MRGFRYLPPGALNTIGGGGVLAELIDGRGGENRDDPPATDAAEMPHGQEDDDGAEAIGD